MRTISNGAEASSLSGWRGCVRTVPSLNHPSKRKSGARWGPRYGTRINFPRYPALRLRADFMTTSAPRPEYSVFCKTKAREKGVDAMLIIGCDYHRAFQQIAFCDTATGECGNRRLEI